MRLAPLSVFGPRECRSERRKKRRREEEVARRWRRRQEDRSGTCFMGSPGPRPPFLLLCLLLASPSRSQRSLPAYVRVLLLSSMPTVAATNPGIRYTRWPRHVDPNDLFLPSLPSFFFFSYFIFRFCSFFSFFFVNSSDTPPASVTKIQCLTL